MKKYKVCAVLMLVLLVAGIFSGCRENSNTVTEEQILQVLQERGFTEAHLGYYIYIDAEEETSIGYSPNVTCIDFSTNSESNVAGLLNAVMPLFDSDFNNAGDYIVKELLNEENSSSERWRDIKYHDREYMGKIDWTGTYIEFIWVLWK